MRYREFIYDTANKIAYAAHCGNYSINPNIDISRILSEDEVIEATAYIMHTEHTKPNIKKVGEAGYRIIK